MVAFFSIIEMSLWRLVLISYKKTYLLGFVCCGYLLSDLNFLSLHVSANVVYFFITRYLGQFYLQQHQIVSHYVLYSIPKISNDKWTTLKVLQKDGHDLDFTLTCLAMCVKYGSHPFSWSLYALPVLHCLCYIFSFIYVSSSLRNTQYKTLRWTHRSKINWSPDNCLVFSLWDVYMHEDY